VLPVDLAAISPCEGPGNAHSDEEAMNPDEKIAQDANTPRPSSVAGVVSAGLPQSAPHLIQLPGGGWSVWRWAVLRGTGFPAVETLRLSSRQCASDADALQQAEDGLRRTREEALDAVRHLLDELRREREWENTERRDPLVKAMRELNKGKIPASHPEPGLQRELERLRAATLLCDAARTKFQRTYEEATSQTSRELRAMILDERFLEAVIGQNRSAFHSAFDSLLRTPFEPGQRNSKQRQHEELAATYWQRYCVKNDTIGFFGPVGWARFVSDGEALSARPGPDLLAARHVYFETWCMDVLTEQLNKNVALRPWAAPRRLPYLYLEGTTLIFPLGRTVRLPAVEAAALRACDGEKTARAIVAELMRTSPTLINSEAKGYRLLQRLCERQLIVWEFGIPRGTNPEVGYRRLLERIDDESLREAPLRELEELEEGRRAVAGAAGHVRELDHALHELESSFTRISGMASARNAGKTYAARTIVYEDCRRDIEVEIGPEVLRQLGPPLSLLLTSARWFTYQVAEYYRRAFGKIYLEIARRTGSPNVDAAAFWYRAHTLFDEKAQTGSEAVLPGFQQRWADILNLERGRRRCVPYGFEQLLPRVLEVFDAPRPGWSIACYHSPDVMIAARSPEAVREGDYELVLGEMHMGRNTAMASLFVDQHPRREELLRAVAHDLPEDGIRTAYSKGLSEWTARGVPALFPPTHYSLIATHDAYCDNMSRALTVGELVIEMDGDELFVRTRDGRLRFSLLEAMADRLTSQTTNYFKILGGGEYTPRVNIDRLVVAREAWALPPSDFSFALEKDDAGRFLSARRWAQAHGMPNFVFAKAPIETKPFYVDFSSRIYIDILAKVVRRTLESETHSHSLISVSEMYPRHEQSWLPDLHGRRYTSEIRIVAVDPSR
jgi:hypothetical protein